MNFLLESLLTLLLSLYYTLEALVLLVVPVRRKNVSGEIVLVSGAGSGIGRLLALEFARLHSTLVLWDINEEGNQETARQARERGASRVYTYNCDCSNKASVYEVADKVKREVGDVSILINNAGIVTGKTFIDSPDALLEKTMAVNTLAHFWTYKAFLPAMIASNHGHLVSIASSGGLFPVNGLADYCSSKFAAIGFAESVALELLISGKNGIKTTIVCPYFINTGMFDGCKTKWPHLIPILDPNYATKKIVNAILQEQVLLVMPRCLYFFHAIQNLLPMKLGILLGRYFGVFNVMDNFKGRV
ncbi:epidermal retinol dehydrogenase 2 isoform X2 [Scyliorhinus canicula]|uniref:epidermal retinol dehydrogenase 2 isoform X2 n=1 Tax=Scyliorhinus canicula TaxID=7830 RepID=UPI0018F7A0AE|nr:epidermal retinol dehydrogenase 2 isoform X2 [Scyliorhinus canicula]